MTAAPLCLLLLAAAPSDAPELLINVQGRAPIALILFNPTGQTGRIRSSELISAASESLERHTDFAARVVDAGEAADCKGRLGCIVQEVRTDYDRLNYQLPNGTMAPYSEHLAYLAQKKIAYPTFLIVLAQVTGGPRDRVSLTLVATDAALGAYHAAPRDRPDWQRDAEAKVSETALVAEARWVEISDREEAQAFFEAALQNNLQKPFDAAGHWEPFGEIDLNAPAAGLAIALDGITVGTTAAGITRLAGVRAGKHTVALSHPEWAPFETTVDVPRRARVTVEPRISHPESPIATVRAGVLWGGVATAVAGAVITTIAFAQSDGGVVTICPSPDTPCSSRFTTFGYAPERASSFTEDVNPSGVMVAPLGYSLAIAGATWAVTTLLIGDDNDFPWIQLVAGAVLGGTAYALSVALNGDDPYRN